MAFLETGEELRRQDFWALGFIVDTVGRREEVIRRYIQEQKADDRRLEQLELLSNNQG